MEARSAEPAQTVGTPQPTPFTPSEATPAQAQGITNLRELNTKVRRLASLNGVSTAPSSNVPSRESSIAPPPSAPSLDEIRRQEEQIVD
jgi:hypothetical protein